MLAFLLSSTVVDPYLLSIFHCSCSLDYKLTFYSARNARIASAVLATAIPSVGLSVTRRYSVKTTARSTVEFALSDSTGRPASADWTAPRQFEATGQPVSRTQASNAMTSRLPRYEAKCVQCRYFQCETVPLHSRERSCPQPIY